MNAAKHELITNYQLRITNVNAADEYVMLNYELFNHDTKFYSLIKIRRLTLNL